MNRRNMALPTAPMLFWGNRWLTTYEVENYKQYFCIREKGKQAEQSLAGNPTFSTLPTWIKPSIFAQGSPALTGLDHKTGRSGQQGTKWLYCSFHPSSLLGWNCYNSYWTKIRCISELQTLNSSTLPLTVQQTNALCSYLGCTVFPSNRDNCGLH